MLILIVCAGVIFPEIFQVREVLLRGLQSFPAEPGMLAMLLEAEQFSGSQQRLVHHQFEVSFHELHIICCCPNSVGVRTTFFLSLLPIEPEVIDRYRSSIQWCYFFPIVHFLL